MRKTQKPNIISRCFRLLFVGFMIYITIIGSHVELTLNYNPTKAKKTLMQHIQSGVKLVKLVQPVM